MQVETGGGRGDRLRRMIESVYNEFLELYKKFEESEYELFNLDEERFETDFLLYSTKTKDFDRRLWCVLTPTFCHQELLLLLLLLTCNHLQLRHLQGL